MAKERNLTLPGNFRYQPKSLQPYFGYDNLMTPVVEVEIAGLQVLGESNIIPSADYALLTQEVIVELMDITTREVDSVERNITKHDIRALVRLMQAILPPPLRRWAHTPFTSYDPLDSARALTFVRAQQNVVGLKAKRAIFLLSEMVEKYATQVQIGRTHGQHALPITVGFWLATILQRWVYNARKLEEHTAEIVGKISGAVGAYNAQRGLQFPTSFEAKVLEKVGLTPAPISTQILPPEPLAYYLHACVQLSAAIAQFARDCRQLMRTEIGEVREEFVAGQVGSSTMAHKRNPITFENTEGMYIRTKNEFGKVLDTLISEHQRDLVGSCVYRDFPAIVVNVVVQLENLLRENAAAVPFLSRISIDADACQRNASISSHLVMAEPIYLALQMAGYRGDAHDVVNRTLVPVAQSSGQQLITVLEEICVDDDELRSALEGIPTEVRSLLHHPEQYTGRASEKALEIARVARAFAQS